MRCVAFLLLASGAVACAMTSRGATEDRPDHREARWVDGRVQAWQPTAEERAFDRIGWVASLREAERLAREHSRPLFLFTYDGMSLGDYRC